MSTEFFAFNLNHLRYFYEVASAGNMRRAAERIGISQPALSKQIQQLEEAIGLELFYRSTSGLTPTVEGEAALAHCERVFGHLRELEATLEALRSGLTGKLQICSIYSVAERWLPERLSEFRKQYPKIAVKVAAQRSRSVLNAVKTHQAQIGIVAGRPFNHDELLIDHLFDERVCVVVGRSHPLANTTRKLDIDVLHGAGQIVFDDLAPTHTLTERYLEKLGVRPRPIIECQTTTVIKNLLASGEGFGVLPYCSVAAELEANTLVELNFDEWHLRRGIYLVMRENQAGSTAVEYMRKLLENE